MADKISQSHTDAASDQDSHRAADFDRRRRAVLARLGKTIGYAAPVTVAMFSMKASACSMTC